MKGSVRLALGLVSVGAAAALQATLSGAGGFAPQAPVSSAAVPAQPSTQQPSPAQNPPPRPVFRSDVNAVLVDLRVVDRNGRFVGDLTKDDFRIFEDDAEQAVTSFSLINIPIVSSAQSGSSVARTDVVSNVRSDEGRLYLIILDDLEEETEQAGQYQMLRTVTVKALARDFVEHHLGDNDRAALMTTSGRKNMTVQFTNDRGKLLEAIDRFAGGYGQIYYTCVMPNEPSQCVMVRDNLHSVMLSLKSVGEWLAAIEGRRKAIVLVSERLGRSMKGEINLDLAAREAQDIQEFLQASARSNVSLYAIDPVGQPTGKPGNIKPLPLDDLAWLDLDRTQSLEVVSEATGGFAATHTNDYASAFARVVEENSSYYLLGYSPTNPQQDGKFRKIRVEVKRPDGATSVGRFAELQVRARSGYATPKPAATQPSTTAATTTSALPADLLDLVKTPVSVSGLALSVTAMPFRRQGPNATLAIVVEARPAGLQPANQDPRASSAMEIVIAAADQDGKVQGGERGTLTMRLSPDTRDIVESAGVRLLSSIDLKPGNYYLSVAADDGQSRGSVRYDVTVPDFSKALAMSGVAISTLDTSRTPTQGPDARWKAPPSLGTAPTTVRVFGRYDELRLFAEIYDNDPSRDHQVAVTTSVRNAAGGSVFQSQQRLQPASGQSTYPLLTSIPLLDMPPGEYVLSVEARSSAGQNPVVSRQVPFSVRREP